MLGRRAGHDALVPSFDAVVDDYDAARPSYPDAVYDSLEPLARALVLEGGAGTGIATRQLLSRGASVVAFDVGPAMLTRAVARTTGLRAVVADGASAPFRDGCADLVCFAQSWHWLDVNRRCVEAARVLRPGGRWAGWWSHARHDGEQWFDEYWDLIERACPGVDRSQRDTDWGDDLRASGSFDVGDRITVPWIREVDVDTWITDLASHSYVMALDSPARSTLLRAIREVVLRAFPDGSMRVPLETQLWIATRR